MKAKLKNLPILSIELNKKLESGLANTIGLKLYARLTIRLGLQNKLDKWMNNYGKNTITSKIKEIK